jgi:hypothetical protein
MKQRLSAIDPSENGRKEKLRRSLHFALPLPVAASASMEHSTRV